MQQLVAPMTGIMVMGMMTKLMSSLLGGMAFQKKPSASLPEGRHIEALKDSGEEQHTALVLLYTNLSDAEKAEYPMFTESLLEAIRHTATSQRFLSRAGLYRYRIKTFGAEHRGTLPIEGEP